jgi:hydrogenase maturation protease
MSTPSGAVLIGIGNSLRRDDGVGPALVDAVGELGLPGISLFISDGEPSRLLDAWSGASLAVLVDATHSQPQEPARIHRTVLLPARTRALGGISAAVRQSPGSASTHGLGICDAIGLAEALGRLPQRLVTFAVEAADIGYGAGLSGAVAACLPDLIRAVLAEFGSAWEPSASRDAW